MGAEIVLGLDQAQAEVRLPGAIDRDARRQWVRRIDQPFREVQARFRRWRLRGQPSRRVRIHGDARAQKIAAEVNVSFAHCRALAQHQGRSDVRLALLQFLDLAFQLVARDQQFHVSGGRERIDEAAEHVPGLVAGAKRGAQRFDLLLVAAIHRDLQDELNLRRQTGSLLRGQAALPFFEVRIGGSIQRLEFLL